MNTDYAARIAAVIGVAPPELVEFYKRDERPQFENLRIHCLEFSKAEHYSKCLAEYIVYNALGLWALNDANDSNPYCLITAGPLAGMIMHVYHDDEPNVAFRSLNEFVNVLRAAGANGIEIDDIQEQSIRHPVDSTIQSLLGEADGDPESLICIYIDVANGLTADTKRRLAANNDFLVREALAIHLKHHGLSEDLTIAETLASDQYGQVARPAMEAVTAIKHREAEQSRP